jgi:hypothetical protein
VGGRCEVDCNMMGGCVEELAELLEFGNDGTHNMCCKEFVVGCSRYDESNNSRARAESKGDGDLLLSGAYARR